MGFFDKNKNEAAYVGGKKHWVDVIKNSGQGELMIWRQPEEDFNTNSTLIVMPGEEAIFVNRGNIEQVFESGTYKLSTENYPFISRLRNAFSGGISTFNCVVYFVRVASSRELLWGTDSPIQVRDPVYSIATSLRANGAYKLQVKDGGKFLKKLIGNNVQSKSAQDMSTYFTREFLQNIKSEIARYIRSSEQEILGICAEQDILAQALEPKLGNVLDEYGIELLSFSISSITIPEDDPGRQQLESAFAKRNTFKILGADWERQQQTEILHTMAANQGAGGIGAAMGGLGVGMAAGGVMAGMGQNMLNPGGMAQQPYQSQQYQNQQQPVQSQPEQQQPSQPEQPAQEDPMATLKKLKGMLDAGLIPQEAYDSKMNEILSRM